MAAPSTLYRFRLDVSDVDRGFYETLDLRVPMHPSETEDFLLTRVLAYTLNYESGLEFSRGLSTPDEPAISLPSDRGGMALWIDIGNPLARRIHKAAKAADRVRIYTYKHVANLQQSVSGETIHRREKIEVFAFAPGFLQSLTSFLKRDNQWSIIHTDGELTVTSTATSADPEESATTTVTRHSL